ncbi:MAG: glycosyltransferase family 1 protein [Ferruginibacter sp.]|nr:glycosyltransferase family 1 protein [Cytophagales bacterium]
MKIAIMTLGTRGDLQPFVALALGLKNAGYDVLLISSKNDEEFVKSFGLAYYALNVDIQKMMEEQEMQEMTKGDNPIKFFRSHLSGSRKLKKMMVAIQEEVWQACLDADAIIYHPGMPNGYFIAKELKIPSLMASPFPVSATKAYPSILFYNGPRLGKLYNLATHFIFERAFWFLSRSALKAFWENKAKPKVVTRVPPTKLQVSSGMPVIYGYSEELFPKPKDWEANVEVTGNWILESEPNWTPPADLVDFIESGVPPVYVGFGSIKDLSTFRETIGTVLEALALAKQRAVIALGWNRLPANDALPSTVFLLESAPHSWLFPRMAAVVHHGGAGTTAAGLHAGKPTVIIPHSADQPAWGRRVYELGVGPQPVFRKNLSAEKLANAIKSALDQKVIAQASKLGKKLKAENGVGKAVSIVNNYLRHHNPGPLPTSE